MRLRPTRDGAVRVAFVVSRKVGKAVVRNLIRRRLREGFRQLLQATPAQASGCGPQGLWPSSFDALVMVRPSAVGVAYDELMQGLQRALDAASSTLTPDTHKPGVRS